MLGPQDGIVGKDSGGGAVQFPLSGVGERAIDAFADQRMGELQPVLGRPQQPVPQQRVANEIGILKQRPEIGQTRSAGQGLKLPEWRVGPGGKQIGTSQHNALNRGRQTSVGQVACAAQQLLQEQRIAARPLDALVGERSRRR